MSRYVLCVALVSFFLPFGFADRHGSGPFRQGPKHAVPPTPEYEAIPAFGSMTRPTYPPGHAPRIPGTQEEKGTRTLLQTAGGGGGRREYECSLSRSQTADYLDIETRTWRIGIAALNEIRNDLQSIVNCTQEGDTVFFDVARDIRPPARVTIPWSLLLSAYTDEAGAVDGAFVETSRKAVFNCPRENEGVFLVESNAENVLFANLEFRECSWRAASLDGAVIEVESCRTGNIGNSLLLHHVIFAGNRLFGATGLRFDAPSCTATRWVDVSFIENICLGTCGAVLPALTNLRNVTLDGNDHMANEDTVPALLGTPDGSTVVVENLMASRNRGIILHATNASLTMTSLNFTRNSGDVLSGDDEFSACIHLISSSAVIEGSTFNDNRGEFGSVVFGEETIVTISDSTFADNRAIKGGVMYITEGSSTSITNVTFLSNEADDGAVAFSLESVIRCANSNFTGNAAVEHGGCFYLDLSSELNTSESSVQRNTAQYGGFAFSKSRSTGRAENCVFNGNKAEGSGGTWYVQESELDVQSSQFAEGNATWGGFLYAREASVVRVINTSLIEGSAQYGGGVFANLGTHLDIHNAEIQANDVAQDGGGIYMQECVANVTNSSIGLNRAGRNGGAMYGDSSEVFMHDTRVFSNSGVDGGGLRFTNETHYEALRCVFLRNTANFGGGVVVDTSSAASATDCFFFNNNAVTSGGHVYCEQSRLICVDCLFIEGRSQFGGFVSALGSTFSFERSNFSNASASVGGCFALRDETRLSIENGNLNGCEAERAGGGVYSLNSTLAMRNSNLDGNHGGGNGGAIYAATDGSVQLRNLSVSGNEADYGGAVLIETNVTGEIADCEFWQNSAGYSGGHMYLEESRISIDRSRLLDGRANDGGALYATMNAQVNISDSVFSRCTTVSNGGCVNVDEFSVVQFHNTSFIACTARENGGALHIQASSTAIINSSRFHANRAENSGGAIFVSEASLFATSLGLRNNHAGENGGGAYIKDSEVASIRNSIFVQNSAQFGGGMGFLRTQNATFANATFVENSASRSGCGVYVGDSTMQFREGHMSGNHGRAGGGFYSNNATLTISNSEFGNGSVTDSGGFILAEDGGSVTLEGVSMTGGQAEDGGAVALRGSTLVAHRFRVSNCSAEEGGAVFLNESSTFLCARCTFEDNAAVNRGGAVSFVSETTQFIALQFDRTVFAGNTAKIGGALHVITSEERIDCSRPIALCTIVTVTNSRFVENRARYAGGAIFVGNPSAIRFNCSSNFGGRSRRTFYSRSEWGTLDVFGSLDDVCPDWKKRNKAEVYGQAVGSYARQVMKTIYDERSNKTKNTSGNRYTVRNHRSGTPLPNVILQVSDAFGQGPAIGIRNDTIEAVMTSPDHFFAGSVNVELDNGTGNFTGVAGFQSPGKYRVLIDFSEEALQPFLITVVVRECTIGETSAANGSFCQPCNGATYSFEPGTDAGCLPCPSDANCTTNVIQPNRGHWHHSPCSDRIQRCLTERGCDYTKREETLTSMTEDLEGCEFDEAFLTAYSNAQCATGYHGPLCGSCDQSYGRTQSFACRRCFVGFTNVLLVVLSILMLMGLSGFTIRSNLTSLAKFARNAPNSPQLFAGPSSSRSIAVNEKMVEMVVTGNVPPGARTPNRQTTQDPQQSVDQNELLKWKAVELFKITINNLQVTAIAISINVEWQRALIGLFEAAEFLGGVTSEATNRSVDCLVSDDSSTPRSVISTVIDVLVPLIVIVLFILIWLMFSFKQTESKIVYLLKKTLLSTLAVFYISYISITKTLINILHCVEVHEADDNGVERTTDYWAVDTGLKCYKGSHAVLAGLVGWPFLFIFTLGFPIAVAGLIMRQVQEDFKEGWIYETAGFLYRSFQPKFVFWECIIMLRKAVLAVVIVFAYPLGGNLQAVLGVFVVAIASYFHTLWRPYRQEFDILNEMEGVSLLVSLITFVSSLVFNDDRVPNGVRVLITILVFLGNLGLLFFFLRFFLVLAADYLKTVLDRIGVSYSPKSSPLHIIVTYFLHHRVFSVFRNWIQRFFGRPGHRPSRPHTEA